MPIDSISNTKSFYEPLRSYLTSTLGHDFEIVTTNSYDSAKDLFLSSEKFSIVNLNGVIYSQFNTPDRYELFAQESVGGEATYNSVFIVRQSSKFQSLNIIDSKKIGLVSPYSTSGALIPIIQLGKLGFQPGINFEYLFFGSHLSTVQALLENKVDIAAVSWKTLKSIINDGLIDGSAIQILDVSPPIPLDPWLIDKTLSNKQKIQIKSTFLSLSDQFVLGELEIDSFLPAKPNHFRHLEDDKSFYKSILK